MDINVYVAFVVVNFYIYAVYSKMRTDKENRHINLPDHTKVSNNYVFPYVVAILKKYSYASAGALLDEKWVLTAADSLYLVRESTRVIRVRLGSVNYKKGGVLMPVKDIEVHPYFDDSKPAFDVALILLAERVRFTPNLYPIRQQKRLKEVTASHFIVTSWTPNMNYQANSKNHQITSLDTLKRRRLLSVSHLHPTDADQCVEELMSMEINDLTALMCLDPDFKSDPCWRDIGAPVVLNGILWGVISSWRPDDCYQEPSTNFVTLVAGRNISSWIHSITHGEKWNKTAYLKTDSSVEDYSNYI